jgi:thiol-disulfide isomerase/thioredoxin
MPQYLKTTAWLFLFLPVFTGFARPSSRTGNCIITTYDELGPLEGVAVIRKGSNRYSGSQADSVNYINVSSVAPFLVFSYTDFQLQEIKLNSSSKSNTALRRANNPTEKKPTIPETFSPYGKWRGNFRLKDDVDVPFIFEITGNTPENSKVYFINAEEKFDGGRLKRLTDDSLVISLDEFDNELAFKIENNSLSGVLRKQDKSGTPVPVQAEKGNVSRFAETGIEPNANISGTYDIIFKNNNGKDEKAVGLFKQDGNKLRATFLHTTGDSRYLDGIVSGNNFYLSSFIGSSPGYYKGTINKDGSVTGEVINARSSQFFIGTPNEEAALPDPYNLTYLKDGYTSLDFSFPYVNGRLISLRDEKYKNKVVIITITGSWCPNCIDEAAFLAPWFKKNKKRGVEAIAIHYERKTDTAYVRKALTRFRKRFGIEYDQVFAGLADKQLVAESLPALNTFLSFPTIIFLDKKGKVAKIHTGYTGPATGKYYEEFKKEFNEEIGKLLKQ